jgi:hypothetical protein
MIVISQRQLDLLLKGKIIFQQFFAALFLLLSFFLSSVFASENTVYSKGLGAVLREQPSIQSKKTFKLSRGTKVLAIESKGIGKKLSPEIVRGGFCADRLQNFLLKGKSWF